MHRVTLKSNKTADMRNDRNVSVSLVARGDKTNLAMTFWRSSLVFFGEINSRVLSGINENKLSFFSETDLTTRTDHEIGWQQIFSYMFMA